MMLLRLFLVGCLFFPHFLFSQNPCITESRIQQWIQQNPQMQAQWQAWLEGFSQTGDTEEGNRNEIYIPVVFHIVHDGDAVGAGENISDAQVLSQIDVFNEDFNLQNDNVGSVPVEFQDKVANVGVRFCLAKKDPQGNPTTGIIRHEYANRPSWDEADIEDVLKPATIWDRNRYFNIWVCRFGGSLASDGVLAYAQFPFFGSAQTDGVATRFNCVGRTGSLMGGYNKGHTLTHEAGHYFGLLHIWGSDETCNDSGFSGDGVNDTPNQADLYFGCPNHPQFSCNSNDMFMNFMDYTDDDCKNMFTNGQKNRMLGVINGSRSGLKNNASATCFQQLDAGIVEVLHPKGNLCSSLITPVVRIRNNGVQPITALTLSFQLSGNPTQTYNWSGNIALNQEAILSLPTNNVLPGNQNMILSIVSRNNQSTDDDANNDFTSVFFSVSGQASALPAPLVETFESGVFVPGDWSVSNPNNDLTWVLETSGGGFGQSNFSASINNLGYTSNPNGRKDAMVTADADFSNLVLPQLDFDVAYAPYSASRFDSLNVYYSLNCGASWTRVWKSGGAALATADAQTTLFVPQSGQWRKVEIPLPYLARQSAVRFRFENVSGWGNKLYLDNINFASATVSVPDQSAVSRSAVRVYPNPAYNQLLIVSDQLSLRGAQVQLYDLLGQLVLSASGETEDIRLSVSSIPSGQYLLHIRHQEGTESQRVAVFR